MEIINKYFSDFTPQQRNQFALLKNLYDDWNSKINVISRKDMDGLFEKHILHSLSITTVFSFEAGTEILDLGTGGGFPGIPLAIFFPNVKFHLVDSIAKKLNVVENIASSIGATNITVQHTRAEEIKGRKFEYVVSRAVAPLGDLWKWSKPLIRNKSVASDKKNGLMRASRRSQNVRQVCSKAVLDQSHRSGATVSCAAARNAVGVYSLEP